MPTINEILAGAAAIAKGMGVTVKEMLNPVLTDDYPGAPPKFQQRYRGLHVLQRDENGLEKCVACFLCSAACPAQCIYIEAADNTGQARMSGCLLYTSLRHSRFRAAASRREREFVRLGVTEDVAVGPRW